jgi:hypothetical protein
MKQDDRSQGTAEEARGDGGQQGMQRPAPGKVTLTSKLSPDREPAVQRQAPTTGAGAAAPRRSLWDLTMDPAMDAAHRGVTALAAGDQDAVQMALAPSRPATAPATAPTAAPAPWPGRARRRCAHGPAAPAGYAGLRQRPAPRGARVVVRQRVPPDRDRARLRPGLSHQYQSPRTHGQALPDQGRRHGRAPRRPGVLSRRPRRPRRRSYGIRVVREVGGQLDVSFTCTG